MKNTKKDISENLINYWRNSGLPVFGKTNLVISGEWVLVVH